MEMLIIVAIWTVVVKRGVEDIWHTARGGTPPRLAAAKARRSSGAAGRYWQTLWDDVWTDMSRKHAEKRDRRDAAPSVPQPRGAATQFFAGLFQDGRRAAGRSWERGWVRLDEKRREKATRPRPGQQTVPGTVVPNRPRDAAEDGGQDRPQDDTGSDPRTVPTPDGGTDLQFGDEPIVQPDPSQRDCRNCTDRHWHDQYCLIVDDDPWINQHHDEQSAPDSPDSGPDQDIAPPLDPTTQEGPTTMTTTIPSGEVTSLSQTIRFCEDSAQAYRAQAHAIEQTQATLTAEEVSGPAAAAFATAMEQSFSAADAMTTAAEEFKKHLIVLEAYDAVQGAGTKAFVIGGR